MKKDEKQPESSGVQPGQTPDETPQESGAQTAEAPGEETAPAKETEAQAEEPAPGQEDSCEDPGEEPQEDSEDFDPENGEYPDEEYDWEEDAPLSFGARLFSASTSLLRWIVLVAVLLVLILGGTFFSMYRSVSLSNLPQYQVSWAGQTLETAGYDWSVPVMGFLHRDFSK